MAKNDAISDITLKECIGIFDGARSTLSITPKEDSFLYNLAKSGQVMIDCYRTDSMNFLKDGEFVTAFAAINYAHAWISCFTQLGLFDSTPGKDIFEIVNYAESDDIAKITDEKMGKYLDITSRAMKKIKIAPPARSFDRRLAIRFLDTSEEYFKQAVGFRNDGDYCRAFASVNYSHAWLDGGARMGLFDVEEDDVLFTLYE
jgi:hypothetical protein